MTKDEDINKSIEDAIGQMEHIMDISSGELKETLEDRERFQASCELMEMSRILQEDSSSLYRPDVERMWADFRGRQNVAREHRKRNLLKMYLRVAVASMVVFVAGVSLWHFFQQIEEPITVFVADNTPQQIVLQTSSGEIISVEESADSQLTRLGVKLQKRDQSHEVLEYKSEAVEESIEWHNLSTPRGKDIQLTLNDGSEVWLNAESRLEYPTGFTGDRRIVRLHGEAYFKVAHDKERPFIVETDYLQTRVLGTEFNVRTYSNDNSRVTLINGSVEVAGKGKSDFVQINPGEEASLQLNGSFLIQKVDLNSYIYWKDGYFYYDNVTLGDIMKDLGRWYNVTIQFRNREAVEYRLRFLADRESGLDFAIQLLNQMGRISISRKDNILIVE